MINFIIFIYNYYDWQKPNSTEEKVFLDLLNFKNEYNFNYIAYPWATYVDKYNSLKKKNISFSDFVKNDQYNINFPNNNLNITCFQSYHIYKFIDDFKKMNINIIFSPHCEIDKVKNIYLQYKILILPIFLIPIISPNSNYDLLNNKIIDKSTIPNDFDLDYFKKNNDFEYNIKKYLISFVGTINYNNNELSEFRVKCLETLKKLNNVYIFETDKWHLNDLIYSVMNRDKEIDKINRELNYYQNMLYSKWVLCPKGIGPNSFRISESIKFNNIPIIISDKLMLPKVNNLEFSDYSITLKENELFKLTNLSLSENRLKTLKSNINIVNNYLNNLANPILDFFDEKFNLLIVFFKISNTSERYKEYEYVLKKNINDINIKKIHIFFEFNDYYNKNEILNTYKILNNKKIKIIPTKKKYVREISFNELFDYANNNLFGEKIIISNNDIYFENLNKIKKKILILKNMILAITRTNYFNKYDNQFKIWNKNDLSQDSWIFISPIKIPKQIIYIGWQGCDNRIAYELSNFYNLSNPTDEIICYHYQKNNNINDYINYFTHHGDGLVLNVPFTKLNDICENYNLDFMNHFIKKKYFLKKNLFKLFIFSDILNNCEYINTNYYQLNEYEKLINEYNEYDKKKIILSDIKINILNSIIITKNIDLYKEILEKYINIYLKYSYNHIEKLLTNDLLCIKTKFINDILKNNNINQINISNGVCKNIKLPKLSNQYEINEPILFFGMYLSNDFLKFKKHKGEKYIVWCDKDCDINNKLRIKLINQIKNDISRSYYYYDNCKNNLDFLEIYSEKIKL